MARAKLPGIGSGGVNRIKKAMTGGTKKTSAKAKAPRRKTPTKSFLGQQ